MKKIVLNDPVIRSALIERLSSLASPPKRIVEELTVHEGKAIADVVAVHEILHCYEIKGENDSISRVVTQGIYYDAAFKKTTLVTTNNHLENALKLVPPHWGIMLVRLSAGRVVFRYIRRAKDSKSFQSKIALQTLWRSELIELATSFKLNKPEKLNRLGLSIEISNAISAKMINIEIAKKIALRVYRIEKSRSM